MEKRCINKFTSYQQVYDFVSQQKKRVYELERFKSFMKDIGNPQNQLRCIHIGGTNGKGSSTNYVRSILQEEGYRVGTFTSPSLTTRLGIMRIQNRAIDEKEFIDYANRYMSMWMEYELSIFEIEVCIAVLYFLKHHVDFVIFEVGLGGELDATNIIQPLISAITNIGLDHQEYLGNTYQDIAKTKGGIIKKQTPFLTGEKKEECLQIFQSICQKQNSHFLCVKKISQIQKKENGYEYWYDNIHVKLNTQAIYQVQNSAFAIELVMYLKHKQIIHLTKEAMLKGIYNAVWPGRFETLCKNPYIIIDGAHNKEGIDAFCQSAMQYQNIKIIFSALKDKDTHAMLEKLFTLTEDITVCEFDFYRAQSAIQLAESFPVKIEKNWQQAIEQAYHHNGTVFITGSLYFISQVREYILNKN